MVGLAREILSAPACLELLVGEMVPIPQNQVIPFLELGGRSRSLRASVLSSRRWLTIHGREMDVEQRHPEVFGKLYNQETHVFDADDTLLSASRLHREEYERLESSPALRERGVHISVEQGRALYEASKISVGKESRYTPSLNKVLDSSFIARQESGDCEEKAWEETLNFREEVAARISNEGEQVLSQYPVDPDVEEIFMGISPADFVYRGFVQDVLARTRPSDIRIIATRGKIEGPLGQVDKIHRSGLIGLASRLGRGFDAIIYSNDVKADVLRKIREMIPGAREGKICIYDDNPAEVKPYLEVADELQAKNVEVVRVAHPDAKRADVKMDITPSLTYRGPLGTKLESFFPADLPNHRAALLPA